MKNSKPRTTPKIPKPNTDPNTERAFVLQDYLDASNARKSKEMKQKIEFFAEKLLDWALHDDTALMLREFFVVNGISPGSVLRWSKRSKLFKAAYEMAKTAIGIRREKGVMFRKFPETSTIRSLPLYSVSWTEGEDWKLLEEWRASLKNIEEEKKPTVFNITVPSFSTPKPKKKRKQPKKKAKPKQRKKEKKDD